MSDLTRQNGFYSFIKEQQGRLDLDEEKIGCKIKKLDESRISIKIKPFLFVRGNAESGLVSSVRRLDASIVRW